MGMKRREKESEGGREGRGREMREGRGRGWGWDGRWYPGGGGWIDHVDRSLGGGFQDVDHLGILPLDDIQVHPELLLLLFIHCRCGTRGRGGRSVEGEMVA